MKTLKFKLHKLNKKQYLYLRDMSHYSNNLYNYALFIVKKYFEETNKYIGYNKLEKEVKSNDNYKLLPAQSAQQILKLLDKDMRSFFSLLKRKHNGSYAGNVNLPRFKKKGGAFNIIYTYQNCTIKNNKINLYISKEYKKINSEKIEIPFTYPLDGKLKQIIVKPFNGGDFFEIYIQYEENKKEKEKLNKDKYLSIDLGLNNLATIVDTSGHQFILNGKPLKSYNAFYNKKKAQIKSELKLKNNKNWSKKLSKIENKRKWFIDNIFNQYVSFIVKHCKKNDIGNVIIGYNETWKQNINLGKKNNQKFMDIPFYKFKMKLKNKCEQNNISFELQEESYTSKCDALGKEKIKKHDMYMGKRIKRGLFQSSTNKFINADVNGSLNIMRKVIGDDFIQPIEGLMFNPIKINNFNKNFNKF